MQITYKLAPVAPNWDLNPQSLIFAVLRLWANTQLLLVRTSTCSIKFLA